MTRLDYLLSELRFQRTDGEWLDSKDWFAYLSWGDDRSSVTLNRAPLGKFSAIEFKVGLSPEVNRTDPAKRPAGHPLNPQLNGLHWGWSGGYVFTAIEGHLRQEEGDSVGFSYHVANDENFMSVRLPVEFDTKGQTTLKLVFDVARLFSTPSLIDVSVQTSSHSRAGDDLAGMLSNNIEGAFSVEGVGPRQD